MPTSVHILNQNMAHLQRNMIVHIPIAHTFFFFLFFIFSSNVSTNVHACNQSERISLLSFALTLSKSPPLNWTAVNCCHWEGITCDLAGSVTHLSLPSKEIKLKGGVFPSSISLQNLTHLSHLNLSHNSLYGSLDQTAFFLSFNNLEILDLSYNLLFGGLPFSLPFTHIRTLDLSNNNFHGAIPSSTFQQAWNLTSFNVSNNSFTGSIPSSYICLHSNPLVKQLDFSFNKFNGNISPGLGKCSNLKVFRAGHNNLSGLLPEDIYNATKLEEIALPLSSLYGTISERITNLSHLKILGLNSNKLSGVLPAGIGEFPKALCRLPKLVTAWTAAQGGDNDLELPIYGSQGKLSVQYTFSFFAPEIYVGNNAINGSIPFEIGQLQLLHALYLNNNNFSGHIPEQISNLKNLEELDLSINQFTGNIPSSITRLNFLSFFNVSYNNLAGSIPRGTQLQLLNASAFEGNPKLCGTPLPNECQPNNGNDNADIKTSQDNTEDEHQSQIPWFYTSTVLGFIVGFWGVWCPLVLKKKWRYGYFKFLDSAQDRLQGMIIARVYGNRRLIS
ncbi:hypothetical protein ABKV19_003180 [Rosa sericea]